MQVKCAHLVGVHSPSSARALTKQKSAVRDRLCPPRADTWLGARRRWSVEVAGSGGSMALAPRCRGGLVDGGEGGERLLDQVGQVGFSIVLDPGEDGGGGGGQAGCDGDPVLKGGVRVAMA